MSVRARLVRAGLRRAGAPYMGRAEQVLSQALAHGIDLVVRQRGDLVARAARERVRTSGEPAGRLATEAIRRRRNRLVATGAVTAAPGAAPGLGTAVAAAGALADQSFALEQMTELVLEIGALADRLPPESGDRLLDVYLVLGTAFGAARSLPRGRYEVEGTIIDPGGLRTLRPEERRAVARRLVNRVLHRVSTRGAVRILGREVPLGIGVAWAAGTNALAVRAVGKAARAYYDV